MKEHWADQSWPTIMVIAAFLAGLLLGGMPSNEKWRPGWEMLSAIGTMFAAFAALWIAGREDRRLKRNERQRAIVLAARVYLPLAAYAAKVKAIAEWFEKQTPTSYFVSSYSDVTATLGSLISTKVVLDNELEILIGLGDNTAASLAAAYAHLASARAIVEAKQSVFTTNWSPFIEERKSLMPMLSMTLHHAFLELQKAVDSCQKSAMGATSPFRPIRPV